MRVSSSFPSYTRTAACYLQTFIFSKLGCRRRPTRTPKICSKFEVARQASNPSLCASVRALPWADEAEQKLSRLPLLLPPLGRRLHFRSRAAGCARHGNPKLRLKFEVARQASSPSLCASVQAVPWADEAEQQLSPLDTYGCQLSADVCIFETGLQEPPYTNPLIYVRSLKWQDKQAAPVSVPLCEQCHRQMRLSKSFPG